MCTRQLAVHEGAFARAAASVRAGNDSPDLVACHRRANVAQPPAGLQLIGTVIMLNGAARQLAA